MITGPLFVQMNLGLGDCLLVNGLVRVLNETFKEIVLPAWAHNVETVRFMFRDLPGVRVEPVDFDGINTFGDNARRLRIGHYAIDGFDVNIFDKEFYRQAGVDFECRWSRFHVEVSEGWLGNPPLGEPYAFVHQDAARNFVMSYDKIQPGIIIEPDREQPFFKNIGLLKGASEVHCIDSSLLCLWDSLPHVEAQKLFLHKYARNSIPPILKKPWVVLT